MLFKNILGIGILLLNTAGLGYLIFQGVLALKQGFSSQKQTLTSGLLKGGKKTAPIPPSIIPDGEDLLKDMDLSDLDNLDLEDLD